MSTDVATSRLYLNRPQMEANLVDANESYHVMGRATGKSEGILSHRAHRCMTLMPRSAGVNVAESYMQLLDRTLPPILKRWQDMGLKRDVDFWVRRMPPKAPGINLPYFTPETAEHSIFMRVNRYDISVMRMVSQDRPASSNGMSIDWIGGDEAKLLNKVRLDNELMPANRGNERYFRDCHLHHSIMFTTDMPTNASGKWIHDYEKNVDYEAIQLVLGLQQAIYQINLAGRQRGYYLKREAHQLASYQHELSRIQKGLVFYSEASTLENIQVLGLDYIKKLKRNLPDFVFRTAILNERPGKVENTFYPSLSDRNFYSAVDYSFVDGQPEKAYGTGKIQSDCRKDLDLDRSAPLHAALDVGGRINTLVAGQHSGNHLQIQNALYVLHPKRIRHLAQEFMKYYKYYYKKELILYFDHTHIAANPVSDLNPLDEFCDELDKGGWSVVRFNIGVTPSYRNRYFLWDISLRAASNDYGVVGVSFNQHNTKDLRTAMECTQIALGGKTGFEKDKRAERSEKANQLEAPHFTDAADTLLVGVIKRSRTTQGYTSSLITF